ncbi:T9SS type A sorting domain-containing protein [Hymenobacter armeniacus]|uniref:T9SS type A sorting domain-containing protein n=1 Tax=Hymenobacter armeniacus TaxID=2771358 RepID=A0ABR8JXF3_9BACT|nr:T9SS type A sorting domain-containing protein [Hymenobacter armeniacus]MBD2724641.1 T9SS type A sorting domain-containing protein [Hymenobacter armeniacus]
MKKLFTLLGSLALLLASVPGFAQCSNQIAIRYYDNGTLVNTSVTNKGQSGYTGAVCPTAGAQYSFSGSSTSSSLMTWSRVIDQGVVNDPADDVVEDLSSAIVPTSSTATPNELALATSFTTATIFRLKSDAGKGSVPGNSCNNNTVSYVYLTLTPTLSLASSGTSAVSGVCSGSSVTLTASGLLSGAYTWRANGVVIPNQNGSTLTVAPTATTTYTVEATTSCGVSSQQVTIPVKDVLVAPAAPVVCANQSTTLTATYSGTSATYQWFEKGQGTVLATTSALTVAPAATTTYQVVATTSDCSTITKEVTVSVGVSAVAVSPAAATICAGSPIALTALSDNPGATYAWSPATGLSSTSGATVTATPTGTTTYTVTATSPCGAVATQQIVVSIAAAPTYAVTPSSAAVCAGDAATLTASSGITNTTYKWYRTTDLGSILSTSATFAPTPAANTIYRVITTTPCGTNSQDVGVSVSAKPTVTVAPTSTTADPGTPTTLTATGGSTYSWTATAGGTTTNLADTTPTITVSPSVTTTYTVTGANAAGCFTTAQATISVTPLPVELVSFAAAWAEKTPRLSWVTASEKHNAYFAVERSTDGQRFAEVGQREGAGTSAARTEYEFLDVSFRASASGQVYYRLRQVDTNGEHSYSPVQTLQTTKAAAVFEATVFPNPYEGGEATVELTTHQDAPVTFTVQNMLGQTVLTGTVPAQPGTQRIALPRAAALPVGVYYLNVRQGNARQVLRMSRR